jgi:cell division protein FtsW
MPTNKKSPAINLKRLFLENGIDTGFLYIAMGLIVIGCIMLISTSAVIGFSSFNDSYYFIKKHGLFLLIGTIFLLAGLVIPNELYKKYAIQGLFFSTILVLCPFLPIIGIKAGGANRWVDIGLFNLQPVEVAKFFIIVFVSTSLAHKKELIRDFKKGVLPILVMVCLPILALLKQPDLGNAILILVITLTMLFINGMRIEQIVILILSGVMLLTANILLHSYQLQRILSFISPWKDPLGRNYHIIQSFIAIGSGGFFGLGLGQSKLKFFYLPLHYSDFIFSIVCEEGGFILALIVLGLFVGLFYKGINIAIKSKDRFSFNLAIGLTLLLVIQALINICVVIGLFPITGIPLTFISFGGSSFVTSMFCVGVMLNISKFSKRKKQQ